MKPYSVIQIYDDTWKISEGTGSEAVHMYLLAGKDRAILIDNGFGEIPLQDILQKLTYLPILPVLTHGHFDHIGGSGIFSHILISPEDFETYRIHSSILQSKGIPVCREAIPFPCEADEKTFRKIDLGSRMIRIIPVPGHTLGCVCFLDENTGNLFTGDTCCKADVLLAMETSTDLRTYSDSIDRLISMQEQFTMTWPAHHSVPVETEIFHEFREAVDLILSGKAELKETECFGREALRFDYHEIGIVMKKEN